MKLNKKTVALALTLMAATSILGGCGKVQVGYVDKERVGKEAAQIETLSKEWEQKLNDLQTEAQEQFSQEKVSSMSQEDLAKAQQQLQMRAASLNQSYEMQMNQKLETAAQSIASEKKLDVVVDSAKDSRMVLMGGTDITDDVIEKLK